MTSFLFSVSSRIIWTMRSTALAISSACCLARESSLVAVMPPQYTSTNDLSTLPFEVGVVVTDHPWCHSQPLNTRGRSINDRVPPSPHPGQQPVSQPSSLIRVLTVQGTDNAEQLPDLTL